MTVRHIGLGASLLGFVALGWAIVLAGRGTMMNGAAAYLGLWVAMTIAMMLPSAAPMLLLVDRLSRSATPAFAAGYLAVWTAAGAAAYAVDMRLEWHVTWALLAGAGVYQLLPLKRACLRRCRSPLAFLRRHADASPFIVGARHGALCVGCCAALMAVLLAIGMTGAVAMAAVGLAILWEKTLPHGERAALASGVVLVAAGVWTAL